MLNMMRIWKREMTPHLRRQPSPPATRYKDQEWTTEKYNSKVDKLQMPVSSFLYIALIFYAEIYPDYIFVHVFFFL